MRHFLFIFLLFFSRNEASRRGWWTSPFPAECVEILEGVSTTASGLTDCILKNSFPQFTSCEFCHSYFTQMRKYYSRLENEKPTNSSKPCYDILSFGEKVNLIENVYSAATHLWRLPHCAACFDDDGEEMTMNNATLDFFALYADYIACQTRNQGNASAVCRECRKDYDTVNSYYDKQFTGNGAICMDVSNAWNRTRQDWNLEFSCRVIPRDLFLLGAFTVFFLLLPVIFYISMFLNSEYERVPEEKIERALLDGILSDSEAEPDVEVNVSFSLGSGESTVDHRPFRFNSDPEMMRIQRSGSGLVFTASLSTSSHPDFN